MVTSPSCALIADDDAFFRIALGALLTRQLGFTTVLEAASLDDALDLLGTRPEISLALFDLSMPGMKQAASLAAVRECAEHVTLAVVSGSSSRQDILGALGAGVHGYIPKALGPAELVKALETVLSGQIYVPPILARAGSAEMSVAPVSADKAQECLARLTQRQREVLQALVAGRSNKEIARLLGLGEGTVKIHVAALLRTLQLPNRSAAAAFGARELR
ncbi:response regulator transcription factor [Bosea sp. 685]|uniref:response regulator transcription factor n=1 Tax=Bosea sp. 685 TaxID=3080057 RepID=UPI00289299D4|nr:response regulator transcription factor [Bosea sp. 685]WNJ89966.1 response regulator transcription factor [Bosea sp. 685]